MEGGMNWTRFSNPSKRDELVKTLAEAKSSSLLVRGEGGDELTLVVGGDAAFHATELARIVSRALASGKTVKFPDGRSVWRENHPVVDLSKGGSARYTWHRDGNRVRCELVEITLHKDKRIERRVVRKTWCEA